MKHSSFRHYAPFVLAFSTLALASCNGQSLSSVLNSSGSGSLTSSQPTSTSQGSLSNHTENEVAAYMKGLQKNSSGNHLYFHYLRYENTASSYSDWDVWAWPFTQEGHRFDWAGRMTSRDGLRASGDAQVDVLGVPTSISI